MTIQINVRVDEGLKNSIEEIFDSLGITMTEAFRIFLKKFSLKGEYPSI
jgi:addiction module RelB/DinJ family antitoxin